MLWSRFRSGGLGLALGVGGLVHLSASPVVPPAPPGQPAGSPASPSAANPTVLPPLPLPQGPIYTIEGTFPLLAKKQPFTITYKDQELAIAHAKSPGGIALLAQPGWVIFDDGGENLWIYPGLAEMERATISADGLKILLLHPSSDGWNKAPKLFLDSIKASQDAAKNAALTPAPPTAPSPPGPISPPPPAPHSATPPAKKP